MRGLRKIPFLAVSVAAALIPAALPPPGRHVPDVSHAAGSMPSTAAPAGNSVGEQILSHGRFENFTVYTPHATPRGFVLMLSGAGGSSSVMSDAARGLAERGAMVVRIDLARFNANLEADGAQCVFPDGDLENLSHFVQAFYHLPTYLSLCSRGTLPGLLWPTRSWRRRRPIHLPAP